MSLFSPGKKIYVGSSLWNMAGDPDKIPKVMPSIVLSAVLGGGSEGLGRTMSRALTSSTFRRSRTFFRWAQDHYDYGMPTGSLGADFSVADHEIGPALRTALGLGSNEQVEILVAQVEELYLGYWAEDWLRRNRPSIDLELGLTEGGWDVTFNDTTNVLTIHMPGETHDLAPTSDLLWALADVSRRLLYVAYRIHTQTGGTWSAGPSRLFTYRMGTGTAAFDALTPTAAKLVEFVPALPLRIRNESITEKDQYESVAEGFKKLTGGKLEDVLEELEGHNKIDDMDFIFVVQGVPLNTKSPAGKAYIFRFLQNMMALQPVTANSLIFYETRGKNGKAKSAWDTWLEGSKSTAPPDASLARDTDDRKNELRITMENLDWFDMRLKWNSIVEETRIGNGSRYDGVKTRPMLKKGDFWLTLRPPLRLEMPNAPGLNHGWVKIRTRDRLVVIHQFEERRYRMLEVTGLKHVNMVYKNKSVDTPAFKGLVDEELSGFIFPLHMPTLRQIGPKHSAELAGHVTHLVVNSFETVREKWYQTGFFKVIMVVLAITFSVITGGLGSGALGATIGLLGTNAAVGAMIGVTGVLGAVVGAVINGIAGVILTMVISQVSTGIFGDKIGAIIATVITLATMSAIGSFQTTGTMSVDWGSMMRMDNLMALTDSVTGVVRMGLQEDAIAMQQEMVEAGEDYAARSQEIEQRAQDILGSTSLAFDARMLTDSAEHFTETSDAFFGRTLMTGGDLIQMSHALIEGFADLTLKLPGNSP